jgi:3-oxoacyl-[acyl-carrier-protein] synthase-3
METYKESLATLTGGSGAVAVLVTDGSFDPAKRRKLLGGANQSAPQYHDLCKWGVTKIKETAVAGMNGAAGMASVLGQHLANRLPGSVTQFATDAAAAVRQGVNYGMKNVVVPFMQTDAVGVLKHGVELGTRTWNGFTTKLGWAREQIDKYICHQVGAAHRDTILKSLGIPPERDFATYPYLGNIGTVSLPLTAAMAEEQEFLTPGDRVSFMGIGSGLNCLMLGLRW